MLTLRQKNSDLYPPLENSKTRIAIVASKSFFQIHMFDCCTSAQKGIRTKGNGLVFNLQSFTQRKSAETQLMNE